MVHLLFRVFFWSSCNLSRITKMLPRYFRLLSIYKATLLQLRIDLILSFSSPKSYSHFGRPLTVITHEINLRLDAHNVFMISKSLSNCRFIVVLKQAFELDPNHSKAFLSWLLGIVRLWKRNMWSKVGFHTLFRGVRTGNWAHIMRHARDHVSI